MNRNSEINLVIEDDDDEALESLTNNNNNINDINHNEIEMITINIESNNQSNNQSNNKTNNKTNNSNIQNPLNSNHNTLIIEIEDVEPYLFASTSTWTYLINNLHIIWNYITMPIIYILKQIIPSIIQIDESIPVPMYKAFMTLFVSIFFIGIFSSTIVQLSTILVSSLGVDRSTIGATIVAFGAEVS